MINISNGEYSVPSLRRTVGNIVGGKYILYSSLQDDIYYQCAYSLSFEYIEIQTNPNRVSLFNSIDQSGNRVEFYSVFKIIVSEHTMTIHFGENESVIIYNDAKTIQTDMSR